MDLSKSKYFVSGFGHKGSSFGLMEKVTRRIVFVADRLDLIRSVQLILSSKYELRVVDFATAINYNSDLIDNTCCDTWTLSDEDLNSLDNTANTHMLQDPLFPNALKHITPLPPEELVVQDREFFMFVYRCEFYRWKNISNSKNAWKFDVDDVALEYDIPIPFKNNYVGIRQILYLADDIASAEDELKHNHPEFLKQVRGE